MRKVTVGVCGGVAAYKAAELVRSLQKSGLDVHVVMTRGAEEFVRPLTFAALTGHKVITSQWHADAGADDSGKIEHIAEAETSEVLVVAPATADTLAKFANGLADDFLSTMYLATTSPVLVAPSMNVKMWEHPATRENIARLKARGVRVVEPGSGYLACGMVGSGRLAETTVIVAAVLDALAVGAGATSEGRREFSSDLRGDLSDDWSGDLRGETVLVTAGGTREPIDPVRFLGNRSSGKMGYAVAEAAAARGARVVLVSAPTALAVPRGVELVAVTTSAEMCRAVMERLPGATVVVKAAAVADFRMRSVSGEKLKRTGSLTLELEATEDIVRKVVDARREGTLVVAFAAEMGADLERAREKLAAKGADAIVFNDVSVEGLGFDSERNAAVFLTPTAPVAFPEMTKREMADRILDQVLVLRRVETWAGLK